MLEIECRLNSDLERNIWHVKRRLKILLNILAMWHSCDNRWLGNLRPFKDFNCFFYIWIVLIYDCIMYIRFKKGSLLILQVRKIKGDWKIKHQLFCWHRLKYDTENWKQFLDDVMLESRWHLLHCKACFCRFICVV